MGKILIVCILLCGCSRTIYIPAGKSVRLRQTVYDAKVWVFNAEGKMIAGTMNLPEGWYVLPDPGE